MKKTKSLRYGLPGKRPSRFFRKGEVEEIAKHINSPQDVKDQVKNPLEFLRQKQLIKQYGTDSASDDAFMGLAKALKPNREKPS